METLRSFKYFMHLHPAFEVVRGQLMNRGLIPPFDMVVHLVIAEETLISTKSTPATSRPPAMESIQATATPCSSTVPRSSAPTAYCRYCTKSGHTNKQCSILLHRQQRSTTQPHLYTLLLRPPLQSHLEVQVA